MCYTNPRFTYLLTYLLTYMSLLPWRRRAAWLEGPGCRECRRCWIRRKYSWRRVERRGWTSPWCMAFQNYSVEELQTPSSRDFERPWQGPCEHWCLLRREFFSVVYRIRLLLSSFALCWGIPIHPKFCNAIKTCYCVSYCFSKERWVLKT